MWTCPVCTGQQEENLGTCTCCGFDRSRDYEANPTLVKSVQTTYPIAVWRKRFENKNHAQEKNTQDRKNLKPNPSDMVIRGKVLLYYRGCSEEVCIPENVEKIGAFSFYRCTGIKRVSLPKTLQEIGAWAFWGCESLEEIRIPGSVKRIGKRAFAECTNLSKVELEEGVRQIDELAFARCSIKEIRLPKSLKKLGKLAFYKEPTGNAEENSASVPNDSQNLQRKNENDGASVSETRDFKIQNGKLIQYNGNSENVLIPENISEIDAFAFSENPKIVRVVFPESVQEIGVFAFCKCPQISQIVFPKSLQKIGAWSFLGCSSLKKIHIPGNVKRIGERAFGGCTSLSEVELEEGIEEIAAFAFARCPIQEIRLPKSLKILDSSAFYGCPVEQKIEKTFYINRKQE